MSNEKSRSVSRTTAKSRLEVFVTKVNGWKLLTFVRKSSILDFAVVPDTSLKGTLLMIRASSLKTNFKSYRTKKPYLNVFSQEPEIFVSVFRTNSRYLLSLVSHEKYVSNHEKYVFYLF